MSTKFKTYVCALIIGLMTSNNWAQYHFVLNGNAKRLTTDSLFELTEDKTWETGSIWCNKRIDLRKKFTIYTKMYFGNKKFGADGIAFLLQNASINALSNAEDGIGYKDINPSLGVEFDTYNSSTPFFDHVAVERNGNTEHKYDPDIGGHLPISGKSNSNVADGKWHTVVFNWDPQQNFLFTITFDSILLSGLSVQGFSIIDSIFQNSTYAYFGFTSSTSRLSNRHQVMIDSFDVIFENDCKIIVNNQYKSFNQCWNDTSTLNVSYSPPVGIHSKIEWFNGDTTLLTRFKFNNKNQKVWIQISNKLGKCKDSGFVNIIKPELNLPDIIDSSCIAQSFTVKVPGFSSYLWSTGSREFKIDINSEGEYNLKINDAHGCQAIDSFTFIRKPIPLAIDSVWTKNISCFGYSDGLASVINTNKPWKKLSYSWSPQGNLTAQISNLKAGSYTVKVSDQNNCMDSSTVIITEPNRLELKPTLTKDVLCNGTYTGLAEIEAIGGTPNYKFSWFPAMAGISSKATDLYAGIYKAFVKDLNGCEDTIQISINEPDKLSLKVIGFRGDCAGDNNGFIECLTQGGTQGYSWQLEPVANPIEKDLDGLHSAFRNLTAGNYRITAVDQNNCADTVWQIVAAVPEIQLSIDSLYEIKTGNWTHLKANIYPDGNYIYNWTPIDSFRDQSNEKYPRIRAFNKMLVYLSVTDPHGCKQQTTLSLNTKDPSLICWLPTAFTPDRNNLNEGFAPLGEFDRAYFNVYNRWGQLIFESSPDQPLWDGTYQNRKAPEGIYIISADLFWTGVRKTQHCSGSFLLLR